MGKSLIVWALALLGCAGVCGIVVWHGQRQRAAGWEEGYAQGRADWTNPCLPDSAISGTRQP